MATHVVGTGAPTYTTLSGYLTYLQGLGTLSAPEVGQLKNEVFTVAAGISFTGFTPTSTNTWTLECEAGASFNDHANKATNALRYNSSNGAAITSTNNYADTFKLNVPYAIIRDIQFLSSPTNHNRVFFAQHGGAAGNTTVDNCIFQASDPDTVAVTLEGTADKIRNSLVIVDSANTVEAIQLRYGGSAHFCTFVRPSNHAVGGNMMVANYNTSTYANCVWSGFNNTKSGGATITGSNNATDQASFPTGLSGQTSLTATTEFENPSNASSVMDFRLKSTSVKCKDNGSTDSTNGANDIIGTARPSGSAYDIGCWELASGASTQTLTPSLFTNTNTFYAPTVTRGAVSLTPSLFTNTQTFYGPTVSATYGLTPALVTNSQTFYAATVTTGAVTLTPSLFTNTQTFYAATVIEGVSLSPSLFTNTQTFYGPTITTGAVTLTPDLFANDNTFFSPTVTGGAVVASTRPTGGPPGKRIKFNGRFYDSVKDRYRLARDVDGYLSTKQAEQPKPTQKPKRKAIKTDVAVIATPAVVLDTSEIDELSSVLTELKARDSQLQSYISKLRAINEAMAIEEEEFLMMVA